MGNFDEHQWGISASAVIGDLDLCSSLAGSLPHLEIVAAFGHVGHCLRRPHMCPSPDARVACSPVGITVATA